MVQLVQMPTAEEALAALYHTLGEGAKYRPEITDIVNYMREHLGEAMSLHSMAARANLSANYFSNLFTQQTGRSFVSYLNQMRLEQAQMLLKDGDMTIQEVAWQCGFPNASYFNRIFRRMVGMSPGRWRSVKGRRANDEG